MPAPYSEDLRRKIAEAHAKGRSQAQIVRDFGVSSGFVSTLLTRVKQTGSVAPKPRGGGRRPALDASGKQAVRDLVHAQPDATIEELRSRTHEHVGATVSKSAMSRVLIALGLPRKKSRFTPVSATPSASRP
jgi:transposase